MPDEKSYGDSLRWFHTGAASHQAAQADPDASLGNYLASNEIEVLAVSRTNPIANITIDYAAGANGVGAGTLTASGASALRWTPPGGSQGPEQAIANGETKLLTAGGAAGINYHLRVSRTSADALSGTETTTLARVLHNVIALDEVTDTERAAGDIEYRGIGCQSQRAAGTLRNLKVWLLWLGNLSRVSGSYAASGAVTVTVMSASMGAWPLEGGCFENVETGEVLYYSARTANTLTVPAGGRDIWTDVAGGAAGSDSDPLVPIAPIRIGKEAPGAQPGGFIQTIANESTAPAAVTFKHPVHAADADVISIGDLAAGYWYGLWIERLIILGAVPMVESESAIAWQFQGPLGG